MLNIANCIREQLSVELSKNDGIPVDAAAFKKLFIESWNLYEDSANLISKTLGFKHRRIAMIKRELAILLQMDNRWGDMEEALENARQVLRDQEFKEEMVKEKIRNCLESLSTVSLMAIAVRNSGDDKRARGEVTDKMIELVGQLHDECDSDNKESKHIVEFIIGLEIYQRHCEEMKMNTTAINFMITQLKDLGEKEREAL